MNFFDMMILSTVTSNRENFRFYFFMYAFDRFLKFHPTNISSHLNFYGLKNEYKSLFLFCTFCTAGFKAFQNNQTGMYLLSPAVKSTTSQTL